MQQRDRRDALKLLAGGAAAAGATLIQTSTAFADGGTTSVRPPCTNNAGVVIWETTTAHVVNILITDSLLNVIEREPKCPPGWTLTTMAAFMVRKGHEIRMGGTVLASDTGTFGAFVAIPGNVLSVVMTGEDDGPVPATGDATRLDVMVRRVCTQNSNSRKQAWCCAVFKYEGVYVYGTPDTWGGSVSASTGSGKLDQTVADGCTAP